MVVVSNFDLAKAGHEKQAAYEAMSQVETKMRELSTKITKKSTEIDKRQAEYDEQQREDKAKWDAYNSAQVAKKAEIGAKIVSIKKCNALEQNLRLMSENPDEDESKKEVYLAGAAFYRKLASEKMVERDHLIQEKRNMIRPDPTRSRDLLENLKQLRKERKDLQEDYRATKSEYSLKRTNFDRMKEKYHAVMNGTKETNEFSFIPKTLDNEKNRRLLMDAGIPEEFHDSCTIKQRANNTIDIYYGGDNLDIEHGHIVIENGEVSFAREPAAKNIAN